MSRHKLKIVSATIFILLLSWSMVWSGSKYAFSGLDQNDLPFYFDHQERVRSHYIYLYSSLALLSWHKNSITFEVSQYPAKHIIPLVAINIYPSTHFSIQSEVFDFTIWGRLEDLLNEKINIIKSEQEIIAILEEIEQINNRYKELFESITVPIHDRKIITIDKMNFIESKRPNHEEKSDQEKDEPLHSKNKDGKANVNRIIELYEREFRHTRLRADIHSQKAKAGALEGGSYEAAYVRPFEAPKKVEGTDSDIDSFIFRLFLNTTATIRYLRANKIESLLYLSFLLLLSTFIKMLLAK